MYLVLSHYDQEYINRKEELVMLNRASILFEKKQELISNGVIIFRNPDIVFSKEEAYKRADWAMDLFRRIMKSLTLTMNDFHNVNHNQKFWSIAFGRRVWEVICNYLIHYLEIKRVCKDYSEICTTILDSDNSSFVNCEYSDYNRILLDYHIPSVLVIELGMGIKYSKSELRIEGSDDSIPKFFYVNSLIRKMMGYFFQKIFYAGNNTRIILDTPYISNMKKLTLTSGFRIKETTKIFRDLYKIYGHIVDKKGVGVNNELQLCGFEPKNELEAIIAKYIFCYIPDCFVSEYNNIEEDIFRLFYKCNAKVVGSANSFWYNDVFNLWAAHMSERGARVIAMEHGAPGFSDLLSDFECEVYDWFLIWGNNVDYTRYKNCIPGMCIKQMDNDNGEILEKKPDRVLYIEDIGVANNHFISRQEHINVEERIRNRHILYDVFGKDLKCELSIRMLNDEEIVSHRYTQEYIKEYNNIECHTMLDISYSDDIKASDICITDSIQTVWAELLAIDKPTILLVDIGGDILIDDAYDLIFRMKNKGLVFFAGDECAYYIESINNIREWWLAPQRHSLVEEFCYKYSYLPNKRVRYRELMHRLFAAEKDPILNVRI